MVTFGKIIVDFNSGPQIVAPPGAPETEFRVTDLSTGKIEDEGLIRSDPVKWTLRIISRKYFVPWRVELWNAFSQSFRHDFDAGGKTVLIDLSPGALGDSVAWMPAVDAFRKKWACNVICAMRPPHIGLYQDAYPEIRFITPGERSTLKAADTYARYTLAVWGYEESRFHELIDFRRNNLQLHADQILGVDSHALPPRIAGNPRRPDRPTVCIATRASRKCKEWNNPGAWEAVTQALLRRGYRVVCIDADSRNLPPSADDLTGTIPLLERAELLKGAALFIGLPSGLSWLAWACGVPVVMIAGFTDVVRPEAPFLRYPEFDTPYRVSPPPGVCRNCWMDCDQRERKRFDECYRYKNNECTRSITPEMVLEACDRALLDRKG